MNKESKLFKKIGDTYIEITKEQLIIELQESNKSLEKEIERIKDIIYNKNITGIEARLLIQDILEGKDV